MVWTQFECCTHISSRDAATSSIWCCRNCGHYPRHPFARQGGAKPTSITLVQPAGCSLQYGVTCSNVVGENKKAIPTEARSAHDGDPALALNDPVGTLSILGRQQHQLAILLGAEKHGSHGWAGGARASIVEAG